jgi:hypothetical protein
MDSGSVELLCGSPVALLCTRTFRAPVGRGPRGWCSRGAHAAPPQDLTHRPRQPSCGSWGTHFSSQTTPQCRASGRGGRSATASSPPPPRYLPGILNSPPAHPGRSAKHRSASTFAASPTESGLRKTAPRRPAARWLCPCWGPLGAYATPRAVRPVVRAAQQSVGAGTRRPPSRAIERSERRQVRFGRTGRATRCRLARL